MKIFLAVLIIILGGAGYGYTYVHNPKFTLFMIGHSVQEHDWDRFNMFVDTDSLYTSIVSDVSDVISADNEVVKGLSVVMAASLKETFISKLKESIENTSDNSTGNSFLHSFNTIDDSYSPLSVTHDGKITEVVIQSESNYFKLKAKDRLRFRDEGLYYSLIGINEEEKREINSIEVDLMLDHYALPLEKELNEAVSYESIKKYEGCSNYIGERCFQKLVMNEIKVTNNTDKTIINVKFYVYPDESRQELGYAIYKTAEDIAPKASKIIGKKTGRKYNQFNTLDKLYMNAKNKGLVFKTNEISYEGGGILKKDDMAYLSHLDNPPTLKEVLDRRQQYDLADNYGIEEHK